MNRIALLMTVVEFLRIEDIIRFSQVNSTYRETVEKYSIEILKERTTNKEIRRAIIKNDLTTLNYIFKYNGKFVIHKNKLLNNAKLLSLYFAHGLKIKSIINKESILQKSFFKTKLSYDFIKVLLDNGFDPNTILYRYPRLYTLICFSSSEEVAELLIKRGARINNTEIGMLGLTNQFSFKAAVRAGAPLNIKVRINDYLYASALTLSIHFFGNPDFVHPMIIELVEKYNVDLTVTLAIEKKYFIVAEYLLRKGSVLYYSDKYDIDNINFLFFYGFNFFENEAAYSTNYYIDIDTLKHMMNLKIDIRFFVYMCLYNKYQQKPCNLLSINLIQTYDDLIDSGFTIVQMQHIVLYGMIRIDFNREQAEYLINNGFTPNYFLPEIFIEVFLERGVNPNVFIYGTITYSRKLLVLLIKNGIDVFNIFNIDNDDLIDAAREYDQLINSEFTVPQMQY